MQDRHKSFYKKMWETKCARFNAHQRLINSERRAFAAIIWLTLAVVALSLFKAASIFDLPQKALAGGDFALVLCSFSLLVLELYVKGQGHQEAARQFHKCGLALTEIYDRFKLEATKQTPDDVRVDEIIASYHRTLSDFDGLNHTDADMLSVIYQHPEDYGIRWWRRPIFYLHAAPRLYYHSGGLYTLAAVSVVLSVVALIAYSLLSGSPAPA